MSDDVVRSGAADTRADRPAVAMAMVGAAGIVVGGLVAAVTDPLDVYRGSWMAAYLVLVVGVSQVAMGAARAQWGPGCPALGWAQLAGWNIGSAGVVVGTLAEQSVLVYLSSIALVVALGVALIETRGARSRASTPRLLIGFQALLIFLALSIPVGMALSYLRHSG